MYAIRSYYGVASPYHIDHAGAAVHVAAKAEPPGQGADRPATACRAPCRGRSDADPSCTYSIVSLRIMYAIRSYYASKISLDIIVADVKRKAVELVASHNTDKHYFL